MTIPSPQDRSRVSLSVNELRRQEAVPVITPQPKQRPLDREISITLKPWKLVKFFVVLTLFVSIFYLGRLSVGTSDFTVSKTPTAAAVKETVTETTVAVPTPSTTTVAEKPADPVGATTATGATVGEPSGTQTNEQIITKYSKVALATTDVTVDWRDTWGKITQLAFTIKNNEEGTIKPSYFLMNVEGYDDFDKKITLSSAAQTVKAGGKIEGKVNIPGGFAYNAVSAGDLSNVKVSVTLHDAKDVIIASYEREFNLNGGAAN